MYNSPQRNSKPLDIYIQEIKSHCKTKNHSTAGKQHAYAKNSHVLFIKHRVHLELKN